MACHFLSLRASRIANGPVRIHVLRNGNGVLRRYFCQPIHTFTSIHLVTTRQERDSPW